LLFLSTLDKEISAGGDIRGGQGGLREGEGEIGRVSTGSQGDQGELRRRVGHNGASGSLGHLPDFVIPAGVEVRSMQDCPIPSAAVPLTRKRKLASLSAPSTETVLGMVQRKTESERMVEAAMRAEVEQRSLRPRSTTSTYASHAKKYIVFRVGRMSAIDGGEDMFLELLSPGDRTKEWIQYIYHLSASGVRGKSLASHLSGTKAFFRENSEVNLNFCEDGRDDIKNAKVKANAVDRGVLRAASLKRDANIKLPVFQELSDMVYEMAFEDIDDWGWHPTHSKGAATAQLLQTILGVRVSNSVKCSHTDHHLDTEDVIIRFVRPIGRGGLGSGTWVLTCGDEWDPTFEPADVESIEVREHTGKGKKEYKGRHVGRVDSLSDRVCLAVAYWARNSGAKTGEPFFTMRRLSPVTNKFTVCHINNAHVNFVIKDAAAALAFGASHYSSHSARSGFVTKHSWADKQAKKVAGQGAGASGSELAQMGGWKNSSANGAMRMHYDRTTSVYSPIDPQLELTKGDVVSMLSLVEQGKLPRLTEEEAQTLRSFRRVVWGTESVSKRREKAGVGSG